MKEVAEENEQNKEDGKELIYTGGDNLSGDWNKNFVVKERVIKFSQNLWNKICSFFNQKNSVDTENTTNNTKIYPGRPECQKRPFSIREKKSIPL